MARGANHPRFGYLESWLLPKLSLRANIFHFREGIDERQDFYIDIAEIDRNGEVWTTRDLYVDLISNTGAPIDGGDIDELSAATSAGLISAADAETATDSTPAGGEGIARNGAAATKGLQTLGRAT